MSSYLIFAVSFAAAAVILIIIMAVRAAKRKKFFPTGVLCIFGIVITGCGAAFFGYVSKFYRALPSAEKYLVSSDTVIVSEIPGGRLFDGTGTRDAVIFFQGGKVDAAAYAPLLSMIAENGVDCYLIDAPFNIPFFGIGDANSIIAENGYERYFIAGHSLGGVAASAFCGANEDKCSGLIMLGAYSAADIDDIPVLLICGSNDGLLDPNEYDKARERIHSDLTEFIIEGGNHAQFGDYGEQSGDNAAMISAEEQRTLTADKICEMIASEK